VTIRDGPAAVTGDNRRIQATDQKERVGKARQEGRSGSQKTCLKSERIASVDKGRFCNVSVEKHGNPRINILIGPGIFFALAPE